MQQDAAARQALALSTLGGMGVCVMALLVTRFDPVTVLAAGGLVIGLGMLTLSPDGATMLAVFVLYANLPVVVSNTAMFMPITILSLGLLLGAPIAYRLLRYGDLPRIDSGFVLMLVFLTVLLLSSFAAVDLSIALGRVGQYVAEGIVIYWLILNAVRTLQTLHRVMWTVALTAAFLAALSVYQAATGSYYQQFGGLAKRELRYELEAGPAGRAPRDASEMRVADRAAGPVDGSNRYAQILLMAAPLAFYQRWRAAGLLRLAGGGAGVLIMAAVMLTYSRGAFVAAAGLGFLLVLWRHVRPAPVVGAIVLAAVLIPVVAPSYAARIATILESRSLVEDDAGQPSGAIAGRTTEMLSALAVFFDHPILGVGPGQYTPFYSEEYHNTYEIKFRDLPRQRRAHSLLFEMAAETGALGVVAFLSIFGFLLSRLWQARRYWSRIDPNLSNLATAFVFSLLAYLGTGVFLHLAFERYLWFFMGLAGAALHILRDERAAEALVQRGAN